MNKAMGRHLLKQAGWKDAEILMAERVLRHDGNRRVESVRPTLERFVAGRDDAEKAAWDPLMATLDQNVQLVEALAALLKL